MMQRALLVAILAFQAGGLVAGDPETGKQRSAQCAPCHGPYGIGVQPTYPNLAGQKYDYLVKQLWSFKRGGRKDPSMTMPVRKLDGQDIENLAAYFSSLSCQKN